MRGDTGTVMILYKLSKSEIASGTIFYKHHPWKFWHTGIIYGSEGM